MLIVCPNCATSYDVEVASLRPNGRRVRCVRCRTIWQAELSHADKLLAAADALGPVRRTVEAVAEAVAGEPEIPVSAERFDVASDVDLAGFGAAGRRDLNRRLGKRGRSRARRFPRDRFAADRTRDLDAGRVETHDAMESTPRIPTYAGHIAAEPPAEMEAQRRAPRFGTHQTGKLGLVVVAAAMGHPGADHPRRDRDRLARRFRALHAADRFVLRRDRLAGKSGGLALPV